MTSEPGSRIVFRATVACCVFLAGAAHAEAKYSVINLGTLGGNESFAFDINAAGVVTGSSDTASDFYNHAFRFDGTMHDLGTFGGRGSSGHGINDLGHITGSANTTGDYSFHAYRYDGVEKHDLGIPDPFRNYGSRGESINSQGVVAGWYYPSIGARHAFVYDGTLHDLGTLGASYQESAAFGINDLGQATGFSVTNTSYVDPDSGIPEIATHAYFFDGTLHDIGTLDGPNGLYSVGNAINNQGWIAGTSKTAARFDHAFLYDGTTMHDLGTLGGQESKGHDVNAAGAVVGDSYLPGTATNNAFLYTAATGMVNLNSLIKPNSGWILSTATAINDSGQIVGTGIIGGKTRAFLLTPVPEPSTALLLLVSVALWPLRRVRRGV